MSWPRSEGQRAIGVVVPARNEQELLPACLAGLDRAASRIRQPVLLAVVLDACTDQSQAVLASSDLRSISRLIVLSCARGNVGYARDLGARALLRELGPDGLWLANSDADSVVPPDWFARMLRHAERGARAVLGTVEVADWAGHSPRTRRRYLNGYLARDGHRHTHGANLSLAASAYLAAGGFPHVAFDEDVTLVQRLIAAGQPIAWAADLPVRTSGRRVGRAPVGFAQHLRTLSALMPASAGTASLDGRGDPAPEPVS